MNDERTATEVDRRIGQRVRMRRLELGMSQERLAELLGVTFQQVQKYEKGVNRIAASRLFFIADSLAVPISHFYEGVASRRSAAAGVAESESDRFIYDTISTPEGLQLVTLFSHVKNARMRRRIVDLVRAVADEDSAKAAEGGEE
ncbi:MAG: helix-turn-helix domain-containing protein [Alphaproteobacteria bacterium]|nr:helix-turn-helix domain-containing protein [Alphaproteobacteria bacterium]